MADADAGWQAAGQVERATVAPSQHVHRDSPQDAYCRDSATVARAFMCQCQWCLWVNTRARVRVTVLLCDCATVTVTASRTGGRDPGPP
eukprot:909267-Rhodomonas_salina.1